MINSQLLDLLKAFTPQELKEFVLFVRSPYFNRGAFQEECVTLVKLIRRAAPTFSEATINRNKVYRAVFKDSNMVEGKLDKVMSELHLMAKTFINVGISGKQNGEFEALLQQAEFFRSRRMETRYQNTIRKLVLLLAQEKALSIRYFEQKFKLDLELQLLESHNNTKKDDAHLLPVMESLDLQYYALKVEMLSRFLLQQKVARLPLSAELVQNIQSFEIPPKYSQQYPVLIIAEKILALLREDTPRVDRFEELAELLKEKQLEIEEYTLTVFYAYVRNFATILYNSGKSEFLPVLHEIQKEHYLRGYLYSHSNKIPVNAFINTINIAIRVNDLAWSQQFIEDNANRIFEDNDEQNYYRLGKSLYLLRVGAYGEALDILPQHFQELDLLLLLKRTELKLYYEVESDLLPYKIDAFKAFISRSSKKTINDATKERHNNFVNLVAMLSQTAKADKKRLQKLRERIQAKTLLADREWLLEKTSV